MRKESNNKHAKNTSKIRMQELKYTLIGPPCYYVTQHMQPLYNELYDLVSEEEQSGQQDHAQLMSKLIKIVNDLGEIINISTPWLDKGFAAFQHKLDNSLHQHPVSDFMTTEEQDAAADWFNANPGVQPPIRNYKLQTDDESPPEQSQPKRRRTK